ncbi:hypothetical protein ABH935_007125 [Catenulispora sp. GAS73]
MTDSAQQFGECLTAIDPTVLRDEPGIWQSLLVDVAIGNYADGEEEATGFNQPALTPAPYVANEETPAVARANVCTIYPGREYRRDTGGYRSFSLKLSRA